MDFIFSSFVAVVSYMLKLLSRMPPVQTVHLILPLLLKLDPQEAEHLVIMQVTLETQNLWWP